MMKVRGGFTLIELMITMIIMVILTALAIVVVGNIESQARDTERQSDIETLARGLEQRYRQGNTYVTTPESATITANPGTYPGDNEMWEWGWYRSIPDEKIFVGAPESALTSPSGLRPGYVCALAGFNLPACDAVGKPSNIQSVFSDGNGGWKDLYVYEAVSPDGTYCNNGGDLNDTCTRYNLYWISETDKTVYKGIPGLKIIKSKHQQ